VHVAKLRHLAIATDDPDRTAQFYEDTFELVRVRSLNGPWGHGQMLSDGTINLAILQFATNEAAGIEKGVGFRGLHHVGFEVDDVEGTAGRVLAEGYRARTDIDDALGVSHDSHIKFEFKYEGPDGVVFDLSQPRVWPIS
jgi:methylmalonyl-CoA/ethylmalonyl-CoA epimerase